MAITAATLTSDFASGFIQPQEAEYIFEKAARQSVVQQLVRRAPLGVGGTNVPVITGRPQVGWVTEGARKPASAGSIALKNMQPKKMAAIFVYSMEVARANPGGYVGAMQDSFAEAFAMAFDAAALHDAGPDGTAGAGPFATYVDQATKTQEIGATSAGANGGVYTDLNLALAKIVTDKDASGRRYRLNGWALDDVLEPVLNGALDASGRPIFVDAPPVTETAGPVRAGRLMGRPAFMGEVATNDLTSVVGYGGDWSQAAWGAIGGISYRTSTDAAVTINGSLVSLFENNLIAVLAEAEYGFLLNDADAFVKLTNVGNVPVTSS